MIVFSNALILSKQSALESKKKEYYPAFIYTLSTTFTDTIEITFAALGTIRNETGTG